MIADIKKEIKADGFKIRWISCACFEIELPGGTKIITDPYISDSPFSTISVEDITGADYILLSHTHFDHITDVGKLAEKFDSSVIVGAQSAHDLAVYFNMNPKQIYPASNGDVFDFGDCKIEAFFGKHVDLPFLINEIGPAIVKDHGYKDMERVNSNGSMEFLNYIITIEKNIRIFIWGGAVSTEQYNRFRDVKPNVAIMQIPGNTIEDLSLFIKHIDPQIVIPHHHDSLRLPGPLGVIDVDAYLSDLAEAIQKAAPNTALLDSEIGQWYQYTVSMTSI